MRLKKGVPYHATMTFDLTMLGGKTYRMVNGDSITFDTNVEVFGVDGSLAETPPAPKRRRDRRLLLT